MKYTLESSREWYNNLPGKRASAAMIIRMGDRYLMIKDDYKMEMTFPSGVIDPNEGPFTTVLRETKEEVGLVIKPELVKFYSTFYVSEKDGFKDRFHFFFETTIDEEVANRIILESGIEFYKWVNVDEVASSALNRRVYVKLQEMLQSNQPIPYVEV